MDLKKKAEVIDQFLANIGSRKTTVPQVLDGSQRTTSEKEHLYRLVEIDLMKFELVNVIVKPGTNETVSGFGIFTINANGRELVNSGKSAMSLYKQGQKLISDRAWDIIKLLIAFFLGILAKFIVDNW
jgi:hypothetical protein